MHPGRTVLTLGTFDIPHAGHARFLAKCREYGYVIVGVNSDDFVQRYRGALPVFTQDERMELISGMGYHVILNDGPGADLIAKVKPDMVVVGSDWLRRDYLHQIGVPDPDFPILFLPYSPGISSTEIKNRLLSR